MQELTIGYSSPTLLTQAKFLSERLKLKINNDQKPRLQVTEEKLELVVENFKPIYVNFNDEFFLRRHRAGKQQGIVQACKPRPGLKIIDATAGWGRDAFILASLGAEVLMLERNPVLAALLEDGLRRFNLEEKKKLFHNLVLSLKMVDARNYLNELDPTEYPDVIYIDPMHPEREKTALVKKEMQVLQSLIGTDYDALDLIELALDRAKKRVVVKWPVNQASLQKPDLIIPGKTVKFDVYLF